MDPSLLTLNTTWETHSDRQSCLYPPEETGQEVSLRINPCNLWVFFFFNLKMCYHQVSCSRCTGACSRPDASTTEAERYTGERWASFIRNLRQCYTLNTTAVLWHGLHSDGLLAVFSGNPTLDPKLKGKFILGGDCTDLFPNNNIISFFFFLIWNVWEIYVTSFWEKNKESFE